MSRAFYSAPVGEFLAESTSSIVGKIVLNFPHELQGTQRDAWHGQIEHLHETLKDYSDGHVAFEFQIPRIGRRADVILLLRGIVFVLEYKVGQKTYDRAAIDQVTDYALDLKNFHSASENLPIVPILIATGGSARPFSFERSADGVYKTNLANLNSFPEALRLGLDLVESPGLHPETWLTANYRPTPTIVEAATVLYETHSVEDIARHDAAENLSTTCAQVSEIIREAEGSRRKTICFITGVPGAGKTLAGLNIATERQSKQAGSRAVFLSGNDPLVSVLREALARDSVAKAKERGVKLSLEAARKETHVFIQNIRHFRDDTFQNSEAPHEHVVVFDEAQRAWRLDQLQSFMKRKRGVSNFLMSEPHFLLSVMDRHDWCCVVCLVGGGQEINTGEAGIGEWLEALGTHFPHWDVFYSDQLRGNEYDWQGTLQASLAKLKAQSKPGLHLAVPLRSFRAEKLSSFISSLIAANSPEAAQLLTEIPKYPITQTRDLAVAQHWIKSKARGTERYGLLASSGGLRLRPEGVVVKLKASPEHWFLNGRMDVRSSWRLEDVATEFDVQGLELDWAIVCWDADLRSENGKWAGYKFSGDRWQVVRKEERLRYLLNAYRVLLTRARQGIVIFVPKGDAEDPTRSPSYYDGIYRFLQLCGIPETTA
ncbi:MAG: DUF2075 domain-containing protein [Bryobacteraceae bacterium]